MLDELPENSLEVREIEEQAYRIKLFAFEFYPYAIVMAVRILAFAPVSAQGVSGGEFLFYADLKHFWLIGRPGGDSPTSALS